jgi:hypothetical protein
MPRTFFPLIQIHDYGPFMLLVGEGKWQHYECFVEIALCVFSNMREGEKPQHFEYFVRQTTLETK